MVEFWCKLHEHYNPQADLSPNSAPSPTGIVLALATTAAAALVGEETKAEMAEVIDRLNTYDLAPDRSHDPSILDNFDREINRYLKSSRLNLEKTIDT